MPDYKTVRFPARLKALPLQGDDAKTLPIGTGHVAAGMGGKGEPAQIDIVYTQDGRTLAYPVNGPAGLEPWAFKGAISPEDCVSWCRATLAPPAAPDAPEAEKPEAE